MALKSKLHRNSIIALLFFLSAGAAVYVADQKIMIGFLMLVFFNLLFLLLSLWMIYSVDMSERERVENELSKREEYSTSLLRLSREMEHSETFDEVLNAAQKEIKAAIGYQSLWVYLLSEDKKYFKTLIAGGELKKEVTSEEGTATLTIQGDRMLEEIAEAKGIVVIEDAQKDDRVNKEIVTRMGLRTIVNVPIMLFNRRLGSVGTATVGDEGVRPPTTQEREYLTTLASHMAVALDRIRLRNEHRKAEEELHKNVAMLAESKAKEDALLVSIGDGVIATDKTKRGSIIFANNAAEKLLGWKKEEMMGKPLLDVLPMEDENEVAIPEEKRPMTIAFSSGATTTTSVGRSCYYYRRKDGTRFPVAVTVTPIILKGEIIGSVEVFRDITHEKEVDREKSEFVSLASHQLRTPTTSMNWYAEMLLNGEVGELNPEQKKYISEIYHGNARMIDLVNALLTVSRIDLGTFAVEPKTVFVEKIADDLLKELHTSISAKNLQIETRYGEKRSEVESDPTLIRIVFQNLLSNAVDYTPKNGRISVSVNTSDTDVAIEVKDTGCGISVVAQPKIFTKFFRGDEARVIKADGNGLGLYITKSIVEALGGTISFASKEGEGTSFFVLFPLKGSLKKDLKNK